MRQAFVGCLEIQCCTSGEEVRVGLHKAPQCLGYQQLHTLHTTIHQCCYLSPFTAYHLAFASPGPAQMLHFQGSCPQPIPPPPAMTLSEHVIHLWKEQAWPLHSSVFPNQGLAVANAICLSTAHGVCNGSYMSAVSPDFATAAWLLEDSCFPHQNLCFGITNVSVPPYETNAYCAELKGLHALLLAIKQLCSFHTVTIGSVVVGCNNLGALYQAQQTQELTPCSFIHADLIQAICWIHCLLPGITIQFQHVKGHQDELLSASSLPCLAQLNILAEQLAKHSLLCLLQHLPAPGWPACGRCMAITGG